VFLKRSAQARINLQSEGTRTPERVGRIGRVGRGGIFLRRDGMRTLERVGRIGRVGIFARRDGMRTLERVGRIGRVGIFLLIKHSAWYFPEGRRDSVDCWTLRSKQHEQY
jgi:hypothetical protein